MKKLKTIALTLIALVLTIGVFTGCGKNEMANLNEVDFAKSQQVTLDEVSTKLSDEEAMPYTNAEFSLNAVINSQTDNPINVSANGKIAMTVPAILTSPEQLLQYVRAEANAVITHGQETANVSVYLYNKDVYLNYNGTKVKADFMKLVASFDDSKTASTYTTENGDNFSLDTILGYVSYLATPQKVVDGDYVYYRLTIDPTKVPADSEIEPEVLGTFELRLGFDGNVLTKVYFGAGEELNLSIDFTKTTNVSAPSDPQNYIDFFGNNLGVTPIFTNSADDYYFAPYELTLNANGSITFNAGILNVTGEDLHYNVNVCYDVDPTDASFNAVLENSGFVLDKENGVYRLSLGEKTISDIQLLEFYHFTLTSPESAKNFDKYSVCFYLEFKEIVTDVA